MRPFAALALAVVCSLARPSWAEIVVIQSGEHDGYTRVVVELAAPSGWSFGRIEGGYGLRLSRPDISLDLSKTYDRIRRDRLAGLEQFGDGDGLAFLVDCACHADVDEYLPGVLVIDVRDGPPPPGSKFETPLRPATASSRQVARFSSNLSDADRQRLFWGNQIVPSRPQEPVTLSPTAKMAQQDPFSWPATRQSVEADPTTPLKDQPMAKPDSVAMAEHPEPTPAPAPEQLVDLPVPPASRAPFSPFDSAIGFRPTNPLVAEAQDVLLRELSRAASQGLVDIVQPVLPLLPSESVSQEIAQTDQPGPKPEHPPESSEAENHVTIKAETSIDRDSVQGPASDRMTADGLTCPADTAIAVGSWGDDRPLSEQLSDRRQALVGEFDAPSPEGIRDLARLYLYFGFGAEARDTLQAFGVPVEDSDLLQVMARIMDGGTVLQPGRLGGLTDCDSSAALWSVLAKDRLAPGDAVNAGAVVRSFSGLPIHLRRLLGPQLSGQFLLIGDQDTARALQDATTRASGDHGSEIRLTEARLDLAMEKPAKAEAGLQEVVAEDGPASPDALILLIETQIDQGMIVDHATVETAAAMAFEHRGTELGNRLDRAEVLATAASGGFDSAFATLARQSAHTAVDAVASPDEGLFTLLHANADDATFLRHMFGSEERLDRTDLSRSLRQSLAGRMVDFGFPAEARAVLDAGAIREEADRILLARISLEEHDPGEALRSIVGMDGAAIAEIEAEALSQLGYHAGAAEAFSRAGAVAASASSGWRAGDLDAVQAFGTPEQQAAVGALIGADATGSGAHEDPSAHSAAADGIKAAPAAIQEPGPLARNRALLEQSVETRATLAALLEAFPSPHLPAETAAIPAASP